MTHINIETSSPDPMMRFGKTQEIHFDRDYWRYTFAGMAMQGLLANHKIMDIWRDKNNDGEQLDKDIADWAVVQADALLAELEKGGEG